jgi:hypothetical protein
MGRSQAQHDRWSCAELAYASEGRLATRGSMEEFQLRTDWKRDREREREDVRLLTDLRDSGKHDSPQSLLISPAVAVAVGRVVLAGRARTMGRYIVAVILECALYEAGRDAGRDGGFGSGPGAVGGWRLAVGVGVGG